VGEPIDKQIAALAKRQRGYITRLQLMKLGLGQEAIRYRVRIGRLIRDYARRATAPLENVERHVIRIAPADGVSRSVRADRDSLLR